MTIVCETQKYYNTLTFLKERWSEYLIHRISLYSILLLKPRDDEFLLVERAIRLALMSI